MSRQGGFLISRIKHIGGRLFEHILADKNIDAFNGAQGNLLYILWQEDEFRSENFPDDQAWL